MTGIDCHTGVMGCEVPVMAFRHAARRIRHTGTPSPPSGVSIQACTMSLHTVRTIPLAFDLHIP